MSRRCLDRRSRFLRATTLFAAILLVDAPPAWAGPTPGLLSIGSYPALVLRTVTNGAGLQQTNGSVLVRQSGNDIIETFDLGSDDMELTLYHDDVPETPAVMLKDLYINGIDFPANPPVIWRPMTSTAMTYPTSWSWTLYSSNGGVTLTQHSSASVPWTIVIDGLPKLMQEVNTTLIFGGTADGWVEIIHFEVVGDSNQMFEHWFGDITFLGSTSYIDTTISLGGLGALVG